MFGCALPVIPPDARLHLRHFKRFRPPMRLNVVCCKPIRFYVTHSDTCLWRYYWIRMRHYVALFRLSGRPFPRPRTRFGRHAGVVNTHAGGMRATFDWRLDVWAAALVESPIDAPICFRGIRHSAWPTCAIHNRIADHISRAASNDPWLAPKRLIPLARRRPGPVDCGLPGEVIPCQLTRRGRATSDQHATGPGRFRAWAAVGRTSPS